MGLFGRRRDRATPRPDTTARPGPAADTPDPVLAGLTREQAVALTRAARSSLLRHGVETIADGEGSLKATDGRRFGLADLAARVAGEDRSSWAGLVEAHVAALVASQDVREPSSLAEVGARLYPRLRRAADLPQPAATYVAHPLPGLAEVAAVDHPHHVVELLSDEVLERLGGWPAARRVAMDNLRRLPPMHQDTIAADPGRPDRPDAAVHVLTTDDVFGPSRVLVLAETLAGIGIERPTHGVLLTVPNQHLLAVHVLSGPGVVAALQVLTRIGVGEHDRQAGALSPHVYYVPADGRAAQQVTTYGVGGDEPVSITVEGPLAEAFSALGLLQD